MFHKKCFICGSSMNTIFVWADYYYQTSNKAFPVIKCKKCWLEQIFPTPSRDEQMHFYPKNYYSYAIQNNKKIDLMTLGTSVIDKLYTFFEKKWYNIKDYSDWANKFFLDFWCWAWDNVHVMQNKWWNAFWFEFWEKWKKGNIFYWWNLKEIDFWDLKFDLIYISHVFEHVDVPQETLDIINSLLKETGKIVMKIPNSYCFSSFLYRQYAIERDIPRHLFSYNKKNLTLLFQKNWFEIIETTVLRNYGFFTSFSWFIKDKYNYDLFKSKLKYLFFMTFFIEIIFFIIQNTNQLWFILQKKPHNA